MNPMEDWLSQPGGLANRLHDVRTHARLTGKDLATRNNWQPSKVSRIENGRQVPSPADIDAWVRACGAGPEAAQELLRLLDEVKTQHRDWRRRMRRGQAPVQASYNDLVQGSRMIRNFQTACVPGLLQTAAYARRVLDEMVTLHDLDVEDVDGAVAARMQRQQFLYDTSKQFEFLLAEPVLRWVLCSPDVMHGQLDRLQTVIGMPNVRFGVLPMGVQLTTTPQNSFEVYDDLAIVETFTGETVHRDGQAARYAAVLDRLWADAVTGDDARRLIIRAADALGEEVGPDPHRAGQQR